MTFGFPINADFFASSNVNHVNMDAVRGEKL